MNKKLLAGMATLGLLAGGGSAAALAVATPAVATGTVAAAPATATLPAYGPLRALVANGTITQAQATAIHDRLIRYLHDHRQDMRRDCAGLGTDRTPWMLERGGALDTVLGQLVKDGTITQAQATAVTSAYTQRMSSHHGTGQNGYGHHGADGGMMGGPGRVMM